MNTIQYTVKFFSFWHVGSGLSGGAYADSLVKKDRQGLPYIPGKTLKGLLREGAESIHSLHPQWVKAEFIAEVFGQRPEEEDIEQERMTREARCFFSNAALSPELKASLLAEEEKKLLPLLYQTVASTEIDEQGVAKDQSLRLLEVTLPLSLQGSIEDFPEGEDSRRQLEHCMNWVKRMGLNRNRGLGRCQFFIK
jgi:CRISPR/Cas system CSM-associated protein Csm3 (group 7 of RAMP superfamily)